MSHWWIPIIATCVDRWLAAPNIGFTDRQTNTGSCYKTAIPLESYCWWKKSCTTWHVWSPVNHGMNYLSSGARFFPSTVGFNPFQDPVISKKPLTCLLGTSRFKRRTMFCWETQQCCWSWLGRSGVDSHPSIPMSFPNHLLDFVNNDQFHTYGSQGLHRLVILKRSWQHDCLHEHHVCIYLNVQLQPQSCVCV